MKTVLRWGALAVLVMVFVALAAVPALAASVEPVRVPGNPKICDGLKIEPVPYGESTHTATFMDSEGNEVDVLVTINVYDTDMGPMMDFSIDGGVAYAVVAKGGREGANVYYYTPGGTASDTGLHCPVNPSGKYAGFSHIDFCFRGGDGPPEGTLGLSGSKWYDRDMDGVWDTDEPGLGCWKISLYRLNDVGEYVWVDDACTDADGGYSFVDLDPGTYKVVEGVASGCWRQTFPYDPNYYDQIVLTRGVVVEELDFGNVCVRTDAKGYTMGFWSNKNGLAAMNAFVRAGGVLPGGMNASQIQTYFRKAANAVDMCVMLRAQYLAHQLNVLVPVNGKTANYTGGGVHIGDVLYSYDEVMSDFATFDCATATRAEAEWYKDFFDGLNNNRFTVVSWDPCPVPDFGCCQ